MYHVTDFGPVVGKCVEEAEALSPSRNRGYARSSPGFGPRYENPDFLPVAATKLFISKLREGFEGDIDKVSHPGTELNESAKRRVGAYLRI